MEEINKIIETKDSLDFSKSNFPKLIISEITSISQAIPRQEDVPLA